MSSPVFQCWPNLPYKILGAGFNFSTHSTLTLSTTSSAVALPLEIISSVTVDKVECYLNAGASTDFRCRIVTADATTGQPTTTLVDANASATITATSAAWNTFDFTNFTLSAGVAWIVFDSTSTPGTAMTIPYSLDYTNTLPDFSNFTPRYWSGSAWVSVGTRKSLRVRLKTTDGWIAMYPAAPLDGASGINPLIMDTSENPACRGNRFIAPATGTLCAFDISIASFSSGASFDFVLANSGCTTELSRAEFRETRIAYNEGLLRLTLSAPVPVTSGTSYDCYITAGSLAGATTGLGIAALDTSEDSGTVIGCYGVEPGDILGLYVNSPVTEGGSDTPTTTANHVFPWVPVYSEITTTSGGGGETSHVFSA